jgi:hypothetical protein
MRAPSIPSRQEPNTGVGYGRKFWKLSSKEELLSIVVFQEFWNQAACWRTPSVKILPSSKRPIC